MASRYVPPALRQRQTSSSQRPPQPRQKQPKQVISLPEDGTGAPDEEGDLDLLSISKHFWPSSYSSDQTTLHDSAATPGKLAYLIIFRDAQGQAKWESDGTIFAKSNINILPGYVWKAYNQLRNPPHWLPEEDGDTTPTKARRPAGPSPIKSPVKSHSLRGSSDTMIFTPSSSASNTGDPQPIAVFRQTSAHTRGRAFIFEGWFQIDSVIFHDRNSGSLVEMLSRKFAIDDPNRPTFNWGHHQSMAWKADLDFQWAEVKLLRDTAAEMERGPPKVELVGQLKESVNHMMAKLRVDGMP